MFSKLEALLKERGMTINQLAEALEMPNSKFYTWRKTGIIPKTADIYAIAKYLNVKPSSFI